VHLGDDAPLPARSGSAWGAAAAWALLPQRGNHRGPASGLAAGVV